MFAYLDEHRHHHLICLDCGCITEVQDEVLDPVREQVRSRYGFEPHIDHFALYGVCPACQARHGHPEEAD